MFNTDNEGTPRPTMPTRADQRRAEHQILRTDMLSGQWLDHAERAIQLHFDDDRRPMMGPPDPSRCPFKSLSQQIGGVLYQGQPDTSGERGSDGLIQTVQNAGYWSLMQHVSTHLVGLREIPMRVDWSERFGLLYRPMSPFDVVAHALPEAPDIPVAIAERSWRMNPERGKYEWVWECLDISDLNDPIHLFLDSDRKIDLTEVYMPSALDDYQYRDSTGKPYLPVSWYHAERTGKLWDSWYGIEAVLGSLAVACLYTWWFHGEKDGSFSTVLLINGKVAGFETTQPGSKRRAHVLTTTPGAIIEVAPIDGEAGQPTAVQLQPGFKPMEQIEAIMAYEAGMSEYAGVSSSDLVRTHAAPRSGISLSISREGLRTAQARYEPQLRRGDIQTLELSAKILNAATGAAYPESGYEIAYQTLPKSNEEIRAEREDVLGKLGAGLMSKVDAFMRLHPGISRQRAIEELQRIQRENAMFPAPGAGTI